MGKKLLSTLLFLPALAIAQADYVQFETVCVSKKMLDETVAKHGEKPFVIAVGHRLVDEKKVFHPVIMFMNPNTKTWTFVERIEPDTFCVVGVGSKMEPYLSK